MSTVFDHEMIRASFEASAKVWCKTMFEQFSDSLTSNDEIVYQNMPEFADYAGKKILVVGGGPSTSELDFDEVEYDYLWSANHFYKNPVLAKRRVDLAMMMGEPDISDPDLINYREKNNTLIGFEIHKRWIGYRFDPYDKYFCMHTRFYGKTGACPRMMIFATQLGVSEIKFVGLDGHDKTKEQHAFEPGKNTKPSNYNLALYKKHYEQYWKYVKILAPEVKFTNLGHGQEYHEV